MQVRAGEARAALIFIPLEILKFAFPARAVSATEKHHLIAAPENQV
jgi:hypothetical protein